MIIPGTTGRQELGAFLRAHRERLTPAEMGIEPGPRRRTPGLRREEVASRANISPTWYTWLEQGRGGAPSADVLDRLANGLMLTDPEREHLFMLGLGRPPDVRYRAADGVTPRLQRVLDALEVSPAIIKTATWDVIAWNRAAAVVLTDYGRLPREQRNILRLIFNARLRAVQDDWESLARHVVAAFRADVARAGADEEVARLVEELSRASPEFATLWRANEVAAGGEGVKRLHHPQAGLLEMEFSTFAVEGRPELAMIVYNPVSPADAQRVRAFIAAKRDKMLAENEQEKTS
jgi:transcriptional regulator with XRE-family HTH domain